MPIYSHSQLSTYEECPLKYKLSYRDRIKRDTEGVEAFLGSMVHETLKKCYDDIRLTKLNTLSDLLSIYDRLWQQNWYDSIVVTKKDLAAEHYQALGKKMLETYYKRYVPFDSDITLGTEIRIIFTLNGKYKFQGYIDRLSRANDDVYRIHDYKTSAYLPAQEDADRDRQLGLYQVGVQQRWPFISNIRLVWHYLAFDQEITSWRSDEDIAKLVGETAALIEKIETAEDFPPNETDRCVWCEYPDLCPQRKHFYKVEALPTNEYLDEPGVSLVNKYVELKEKASEIEAETSKVKEAILDYAAREQLTVIKGSDRVARIKSTKSLKFPGKHEAERQDLDNTIIEAGKWLEVSQLDSTSLNRVIENSLWDKELIDEVMRYGKIEEVNSIYISKLKEEESPPYS